MTEHRETGRPANPAAPQPQNEGAGSPESTVTLLARARAGDEAALNEVFARAIPLVKRWASGRLSRWARDMIDTDDLVQETVLNTLKHIDVLNTAWILRSRRISVRRS